MQHFRVPGFIQKEEPHLASRHTVMFAPSQSIEPGQVVQAQSQSPVVRGSEFPDDLLFAALDLSAVDVERQVFGIAVYKIITTLGSTSKGPVIHRNALVRKHSLIWPVGIAAAQEAAIVDLLLQSGISID